MSTQKRLLLATGLSAALLGLTACATEHERMVKQGYPAAYADGFDDGCHSGRKAGGSLFDQFKKDVNRFSHEQQYAQGWSDGHRQCETEQESVQRQMRISIEQQKLKEAQKANDAAHERDRNRELLKGIDTSGLKNLK